MARALLLVTVSCLVIAHPALLGHSQEKGKTQEKYVIKIKQPVTGDTFELKRTASNKATSKVVDGAGKVVDESNQAEEAAEKYTGTILEQKAGQPLATALKRYYDKAVITEDGQVRILPYEGKTVLITKQGDAYQFHFEGGVELTADQGKELKKEFTGVSTAFGDADLLPKNPVAINETWSVDSKVFLTDFLGKDGSKFLDEAKSKITGKLLRVYQKGKAQHGLIEFELQLPFKEGFSEGNMKVNKGQVTAKITVEGCIDGSSFAQTSKHAITYEMEGVATIQGMPLSFTTSMTSTQERIKEDTAKK